MMRSIEILLEEHAALLSRRENARQSFVAADAEARALTQVLRDQGTAGVPGASLNYHIDWLRAAERAGEALFRAALPETSPWQIAQAHARWTKTVADLRSQADAA